MTCTPNLPILKGLSQLFDSNHLYPQDQFVILNYLNYYSDGRNNKFIIPNQTKTVSVLKLRRREWGLLERFRTGVEKCNRWEFEWDMTFKQPCDCGVFPRLRITYLVIANCNFLLKALSV